MQLAVKMDSLADPVGRPKEPSDQSSTAATRKIGIRLTEKVFELLEAATDRPGVGKSMIVEAEPARAGE